MSCHIQVVELANQARCVVSAGFEPEKHDERLAPAVCASVDCEFEKGALQVDVFAERGALSQRLAYFLAKLPNGELEVVPLRWVASGGAAWAHESTGRDGATSLLKQSKDACSDAFW